MFIPDGILNNDERAVFALRALYGSFGYSQYKMNKFEEYDLYAGNKSFLVSDGVITFTDRDGKLMALKPDVTLSIVRSSPAEPRGVSRLCYDENVYRVPNGAVGYKEITQLGIECIGELNDYCVSEVLSLAAKSLATVSPEYRLAVSDLGILSLAMDRAGLAGEKRAAAEECIAKKDLRGLRALCADCCENENDFAPLLEAASARGNPEDALERLKCIFPEAGKQADRAKEIISAAGDAGIELDFSVIGNANYYNGIVFKGYISGLPSALLSGGQYDNLMQRMGKKSRAAGFAVYLDLLSDLPEEPPEYDFDVLLVTGECRDVKRIAGAAKKLVDSGRRVFVAEKDTGGVRAREITDIREVP